METPQQKLPQQTATENQLSKPLMKSMQGLTSQEQMIYSAYRLPLKIRNEETPSLTNRVKAMLVKATYVIGINAMPDDVALSVIVDQLQKYHSMITVEEVSTAIELNCAGKLASKIECYGQISANYLADVINLYQDEKLKTALKVKQIMEKTESEKPKEVATPEQCYNFIKKFKAENGTMPQFADWHKAFDWMWQNGLTKPRPELVEWMDFEKQVLIAKITGRIKSAANLTEKRELELSLAEDAIKLELRKMYITEHL